MLWCRCRRKHSDDAHRLGTGGGEADVVVHAITVNAVIRHSSPSQASTVRIQHEIAIAADVTAEVAAGGADGAGGGDANGDEAPCRVEPASVGARLGEADVTGARNRQHASRTADDATSRCGRSHACQA